MRGGWHGPMGTVGGLTRTYGLQDHFTKPERDGPGTKISRVGLRRAARYFRPYWAKWLVILGCIGVAAGLGVLPPFCVAAIFDLAIPHRDGRLLAEMAGAMVGLALASGLISVLQQTLTARVGQGIVYDLRNELYRHLQRLSLRFYTTTRSGEIVSRINNDVNAVQGVATGTLVTIAANVATLAATAIALFTRNWRLALVAVAVVPAFYLPSQIVGRIRRRLSIQTQESQAGMLAFLNEHLHVGGALLMNIFGQRQGDAREFAARSAGVRDLNVKQTVVGRWLFMILSVFSAAGPALIYWYGGWQVMREEMTPGLLIAFAALLTQLYRPMVQLATVYVDIQAALGVFDRIFEYLDLVPDVRDGREARAVESIRGHVVFEGVAFSYPRPAERVALPQRVDPAGPALLSAAKEPNGDESRSFAALGMTATGEAAPAGETTLATEDEAPAERFALQDVSFEIRPGQRVALVGPSGAGKTTITYLLPRFYDPDAGRIMLDGIDLRELRQEELRRHIGVVTQETFLFHATIRENLLYAKADATDAEMVAACRAANIHEFIAALPDRYDTVVGERGFRLSGGEKQRVSMARAILKDPAILILDEATSNLDAVSEYLIQEALEKLLRGRTSLIIAHRLSTILSADQIVVMEGGRVVDAGRHAELLGRHGLYARLFEQQFGKVLGHEGRVGATVGGRGVALQAGAG